MKKILTLFVTLCLIFSLSLLKDSNALGFTSSPTFTVGSTKVAFAGYEWWVIGYDGNGIYTTSNDKSITLISIKTQFGETAYRTGSDSALSGYTRYDYVFNNVERTRYFINNPSSMTNWTKPNEYAGSTLQQKLETIASQFSTKEAFLIKTRNLSSDELSGPTVTDQKLWPLSQSEYAKLDVNVKKGTTWLRTPDSKSYAARANDNYRQIQGYEVGETEYIRPGLSLDLSSLLFVSDASATTGKAQANTIGKLVDCSATSGTIKLTMKDSNQQVTLSNITTDSSNGKIHFSYSNATVGTNQYVSCILQDASGNVVYYGKLADCATNSYGNAAISLMGVTDGTYSLKIFAEQANGEKYTDFCSEPISMTLTVKESKGTITNYTNTHTHTWSTTYNSDETSHWHECTAANCPITVNSDKDGYSTHNYDQSVVSAAYLKSEAGCENSAVYYKSCVCGKHKTTTDAATFTVGEPLGHKWSEEYKYDEFYHWHECLRENCPLTDNSKKDGYELHHIEDDGDCTTEEKCECGVVFVNACKEHSWGQWQQLEKGTHVRYCEYIKGCNAKETGDCVDKDSDGYCDLCKAEMPKAPATGDGLSLYVALSTMSASALTILFVSKKKKKQVK